MQICVPSLADKVELFLRAAWIGGSVFLFSASGFRDGFVMMRLDACDGGSVTGSLTPSALCPFCKVCSC